MKDQSKNKLIETAHKKIDRYLSGKMTAKETEAFWVFLIENPEFRDHLHLEANLRHLAATEPAKLEELLQEAEASLQADDALASSQAESEAVPYSAKPTLSSSEKPQSQPSMHKIKPYLSWIAAAAAVLLLVWGLNLLSVSSQTGEQARMALIDRLDVPHHADYLFYEPIDAFRNDDPADRLEEIIDLSLLLAFSASYEEALELYEEVIEFYPDDPRVSVIYLNKGLTEYNLERWDAAVTSFQRTLSFDDTELYVREKANWFMANAYIEQGLLFRALRPLRLVAEKQGQFGNDASEFLSLIRPFLLDEYIQHVDGDFDFETFDGYEFLEDVDLD
ncbi:hypothetical protein CYPRO_0263 [Cyclonatronum proteinivorum]|uniref:Tetratricopeptide repeat-containing protein n=1 Tax=Cyclonatronum proteinivorum TaxID=1457365 RepID=A0A345UGE9_9BACT|nr:hypothetical protein [Cyclonatronum proteinivorum]AXI99550.1 hypothetical protein CYPRO_0263 [Cyclonatronum proteinivorum]